MATNTEAKQLADDLLAVARKVGEPNARKKMNLDKQKAAFKVFVQKFKTRGGIKMPKTKKDIVEALEPEIVRRVLLGVDLDEDVDLLGDALDDTGQGEEEEDGGGEEDI